jgi:hypothetical protein
MRKNTGALDTENREWSLIGVYKKTNEGLEKTLSKTIKKETNIDIENIEPVSKNYFFAKLTDNNVNNIHRDEFQLLNFFTSIEATNLLLSNSTKEFLEHHSDLINVS